MTKFYDKDTIHVILGHTHQGYLYRRLRYWKNFYQDEMNILEWLNDYKEDDYPIRYYMDKGIIEFIEGLQSELYENKIKKF